MAPHPLRRLAASGLAYQSASLVAGVLALVTLPLYTAHLAEAELGWAETLLTWIILLSILLRAGLQEALLRHWFHDDDPARRGRLARRVLGVVLVGSTVVAALVVVAAPSLAGPLLGDAIPGAGDDDRATTIRVAALGVWAFTNLETANALLRAREARRTYLAASLTNVVLTVATTVTLVVVLDGGAPGYLLGNYAASTVVLLGVWWAQRAVITAGLRTPAATDRDDLRPLLRFGLPTVPPEAAVFALNLVDRQWLIHSSGAASAGIYAAAVKLATLVIVVARAFQAAWPPLAYDLDDDAAPRAYAQVVRAYVVALGWVVAALALLRHQVVQVLVADDYAAAAGALPWLALGWALWGLTWVFTSIAGRVHRTGRTLPAAILGLAVNVVVLAALVPSLAATGAAIALVAAYVVALAVAHLRTRRLLRVPFERGPLTAAVVLLTIVAAAGDWILPADGAGGIAGRVLLCAAIPPLLVAVGAVRPSEVRRLAGAVRARRRR
ncbi:MAG: oligosaccharide flippase family protein [Solirubrobacteraceae bacterium]|nr:oligosaccharide flippase family protein [Solirubrobacteraceae bacterium]